MSFRRELVAEPEFGFHYRMTDFEKLNWVPGTMQQVPGNRK